MGKAGVSVGNKVKVKGDEEAMNYGQQTLALTKCSTEPEVLL